ncbi:hypothetical protein EDI_274250 [Entamoeba dispar SAW760]|uniref:Uncharacterized protein n=1 Tax=Entamoeba dispar (strain ATCC PRA-260 / SAW760) TaxID=370354 RepID=B0E5Z2_ENTDS|nr:uncharacterized protein EDI_274250 [Entamoeba dispar SAW760]EDR30054.1 hypothetical protein EDI_274250 [Entamoeba dispar SAW760]|eukprot:EDR30054.1 hypothetical protein EDI_274250 [Entamoeba dispar SAW760]
MLLILNLKVLRYYKTQYTYYNNSNIYYNNKLFIMTQIGVVQYKYNQNNAYNEFENIIIDRFDDMKWKLEILLILKVKNDTFDSNDIYELNKDDNNIQYNKRSDITIHGTKDIITICVLYIENRCDKRMKK